MSLSLSDEELTAACREAGMTDKYEIGWVVQDLRPQVRLMDRATKRWCIDPHGQPSTGQDAHKREAKREQVARRKAAKEWKRTKFEGQRCVCCGYAVTQCLDPHHIDPSTKTANIRDMVVAGRTIEDLEAEWSKCILLCKNCHFEVHIGLRKIPGRYL